MEIIVLNNQSLFDIALTVSGNIEAAYDIARENNIPLTGELRNGQLLAYSGVPMNNQIVNYYRNNAINPATALSAEDLLESGINYWAIEIDFIIS